MLRRLNRLSLLHNRYISHSTIMSPNISLRRRAVERVPIPTPMEIHLTAQEEQICDLLNGCTQYLKEEKSINTSCRIAGGWVRDKLLGHECHDIDIALADMMGVAFAEHLSSYAQQKGVKTGTISKIALNPDQSKHLETATLKVNGLDIDLVNLRSEEYAEDSRIPTGVAFGTPLEDARRRDITINALFYNVHTKEVEDFTEKGLDDLREGFIRTPLPPKETFKDDPLRVLRCIRFASRLGYELVEELKAAAMDPVIQGALVTKVARERVGVEIDKMMQGRDSLRSIELFHQLSLYNSVFFAAIPSDITSRFSQDAFDPDRGLATATILHALLNNSHPQLPAAHPLFLKHSHSDRSAKPRLFLAAALTPYQTVSYTDKKGKEHPGVEAVVRESLKLGAQNHYIDGIPSLFLGVEPFREVLKACSTYPQETVRSSIGLALRNRLIHNPNFGIHWTECALFSLVTELGALYNVSADSFDVEKATEICDKYNSFASRVEDLDLYGVGDAVPLLNGKEVMNAMGTTKGGPWLAVVQLKILQWQLDNPKASSQDCLRWLEDEKAAGALPSTSEPPSKKPRVK